MKLVIGLLVDLFYQSENVRVERVYALIRSNTLIIGIFTMETVMKTIQVSDDDYKVLMELSKELQIQENDSQAFPYFWSPRSTKYGIGTDDDEKVFYSDGDDTCTAEELYNDNDDLRNQYLEDNEIDLKTEFDDIDLDDWEDFIGQGEYTEYYRREEEVSENNFSLFKSDVKQYIKHNSHHLGGRPHTYANTIWRMQKMVELVKCLYRLNPQPKEDTNDEAFVYRER